MAPRPSSKGVSERMRRQRRRDTAPELALRRALHARGHRYRVDAPLPGLPRRRADLLFPGARVAVFVDGCFWHGCPVHATEPRSNRDWWQQKLAGNRDRDRDTNQHLLDSGWAVIRIWECTPLEEGIRIVEDGLTMAETQR
ncbi:very short patch repair endonuclease [Flexivirga sp. B27]